MDLKLNERMPGLRQVFGRTVTAARKVILRRARVLSLVRTAYRQLAEHQNLGAQFRADLETLLRLARAWATGRYRAVPWKSVLFTVAAILYFINPADLIPDVLVGIGFVDDAAVLAAVIRAIHNDLQKFDRWELEATPRDQDDPEKLAAASGDGAP